MSAEEKKGPMAESDIEEAVEKVRAIGRGQQKGYFAIVAMTEESDGITCHCMSKVTNTNTHDILRTFYSTMHMTAKDRGLYEAMEGFDDN